MWKWLLRWEYANCSQGWIYNLPCPLYRLSIVYITEIDCSWSSCTENKWNLNWTQHTHKYKRDKQFTQIHNWPAQMIRELSKCKFLLTPTQNITFSKHVIGGGGDEEPPMPRVRDGPKCAYELLTLGALSFPLKCCNSAFSVSRDNLQIRDRKTPQIRWLAHLLRICSVFALSTEKRQSDSLGRARLYCDNSQVMALVRFYTAGTLLQTIVRWERVWHRAVARKELVRYS